MTKKTEQLMMMTQLNDGEVEFTSSISARVLVGTMNNLIDALSSGKLPAGRWAIFPYVIPDDAVVYELSSTKLLDSDAARDAVRAEITTVEVEETPVN